MKGLSLRERRQEEGKGCKTQYAIRGKEGGRWTGITRLGKEKDGRGKKLRSLAVKTAIGMEEKRERERDG